MVVCSASRPLRIDRASRIFFPFIHLKARARPVARNPRSTKRQSARLFRFRYGPAGRKVADSATEEHFLCFAVQLECVFSAIRSSIAVIATQVPLLPFFAFRPLARVYSFPSRVVPRRCERVFVFPRRKSEPLLSSGVREQTTT